jgi:ferrochelatase
MFVAFKAFSHCGIPQMKAKVGLFGFGGPESLEKITPFLLNLFNDRKIFKFPFQSQIAPYLTAIRTRRVSKHYKEIGGFSPVSQITYQQSELIRRKIEEINPQIEIESFVGFCYSAPFIENVIRKMEEENDNSSKLIAFLQYPQYSQATSAGLMERIVNSSRNISRWLVIERWFDSETLVLTMSNAIKKELESTSFSLSSTALLFTAHSLPLSYQIEKGDLYAFEVGFSMLEIIKSLKPLKLPPHFLAWQSQFGPNASNWIRPSLHEAVEMLASRGFKELVVIPVCFSTDNLEVLYEIDIELTRWAEKSFGISIRRVPLPNTQDIFIEKCSKMILDKLAL